MEDDCPGVVADICIPVADINSIASNKCMSFLGHFDVSFSCLIFFVEEFFATSIAAAKIVEMVWHFSSDDGIVDSALSDEIATLLARCRMES